LSESEKVLLIDNPRGKKINQGKEKVRLKLSKTFLISKRFLTPTRSALHITIYLIKLREILINYVFKVKRKLKYVQMRLIERRRDNGFACCTKATHSCECARLKIV
jgi:hypothetical protein